MEDNENLTHEMLEKASQKMILSASGWRGLFNIENSEQSTEKRLEPSYEVLTVMATKVFADFLKSNYPNIKKIVLARDGRPTGENIEKIVFCTLKDSISDVKIMTLGIAPIPETMSFARDENAAFFYISASHNPIGYNGFKFGIGKEGVIPSDEAKILIQNFKEMIKSHSFFPFSDIIEKAKTIKAVESLEYKKEAVSSYLENAMKVISLAFSKDALMSFFDSCKNEVANLQNENPIYIVCDFNGSARATSIDRSFFENLKLNFLSYNDVAGNIVHEIIPEGESLNFACKKLEALYREKDGKGIFLAYMPDCDGDRGNVVYIDAGKAKILKSQEVFALSVISEVLHAKINRKEKLAVVANGPTSMLLDEISSILSFTLVRSEVGEANVISLANEMTKQGYNTRILGEGSNGGAIIPPSLVRDPINTLFALLKFFLIKHENISLFNYWLKANGKKEVEHFSFSDIVKSLPCYATTPVASERAVLKCKIEDYKAFKLTFQKIFLNEWQKKCDELKNAYGIVSYRAFAYVGKETIEVTNDFSLTNKGGLKIIFYGENEEKIAFIWMRASGTEPVFRIMADIKNASEDDEKMLVEWEKKMILSSLSAKTASD